MSDRLSRRNFLTSSAVSGGALATAWHVNPTAVTASNSSLEKLNIAAIGTGNRAAADIAGCASQNIVALADIDSNFLGAAGEKYKGARRYTDFRVMLETEGDKLDAVIVGTPDHTHAPAAAMAMRMGKHTYCEKPLTHTVYEARKLAELAAENNLVTQMGTQIHAGDNYRRVVEAIQSGTIGPVREVHVWVGVDYSGGKLVRKSPPRGVDWDLWLGPAQKREYVESTINGKHETVHPFHWRWFWDYGSGGLGDFGCHYMDLAHWALKLKHPSTVAATGPNRNDEATTSGIVVKYEYPARDDHPPVNLTWYDGGKKPDVLSSYKDQNGKPLDWGGGQLFVGERGAIISNYSSNLLLPKNDGDQLQRPEPYIPKSIGHHNEWIEAINTGGSTTCNFDYSGALTEAVLLGVVSYRSGASLNWDAKNLRVTNSKTAQDMIHKEYRNGWTL
ncbi:MAG: Gfo/Idh/MocA family oxidoreductase [Fuerstiella sp.]|nr:Gfo/Idh/MocA family oxidoreductase [Fuerstiella sp.]MCP4513106.1 Gfo/Idh/MocA family oxidoreductase [Fuerstiella sp.]MDG2129011.1 Gfo/Idh/MocA family oxidoreductase [Fuerstiella sp.]